MAAPFHIAISSFVSFFLLLTLSVLALSLYTFFKKIDENPQEKSKIIPSLPVDNTDNYDRNRTQQQKQEYPNESDPCINGDPNNKNGSDQEEKKRKKKRVKKKRPDSNFEEKKEKEEFVCVYPFTKSSSAIQRKIKLQYDQLVKSHESKGLTLAQVLLLLLQYFSVIYIFIFLHVLLDKANIVFELVGLYVFFLQNISLVL